MKPLMSFLSVIFLLGMFSVAALLQTGCEEAKGLHGLKVDPSSSVLTTNGQTVVFTVTGGITNDLALPLTWRVSDERLGRIISSSSRSATYQRFSVNGVNSVTVRDQYDNEGFATVRNSAVSSGLELSASAETIQTNEASTITITTGSAQAPFSWRLRSGPGSLTSSSGSRSAAYSSGTTGVGVIEVSDANGTAGVIAIVVKEPTTDD